MKICPVYGTSSVPKKDNDGNIYAWEIEAVETGDYEVKVDNLTASDIASLEVVLKPGDKQAIHALLERLLQSKPLGKSDMRKASVILDLSFDLYETNVSNEVVAEVCTQYRRTADSEFFPDCTWFYKEAQKRMAEYKAIHDKATNRYIEKEGAVDRKKRAWDEMGTAKQPSEAERNYGMKMFGDCIKAIKEVPDDNS